MGILAEPLEYMRALKLPKGFTVCELGDQWVTAGAAKSHYLAEQFYKELGCGRYVSVDGNGRGTVTADLNEPLKELKLGQFDLVTDFGTGEHVFNQYQVWKTVHDLTKVGAYIVFDRPVQGYPGHCYYRTDECLFHDLPKANGYKVIVMGKRETTRGLLIRGVWQRLNGDRFIIPQQGRYHGILKI